MQAFCLRSGYTCISHRSSAIANLYYARHKSCNDMGAPAFPAKPEVFTTFKVRTQLYFESYP